MKEMKIVAIGNCVGKTALLQRYAKNKNLDYYSPTIFDNETVTLRVDGKPLKLDLFKTSGYDEYDKVRLLSYPGTDACLICFGINSPNSFENISVKWFPEATQHMPNVPIVLVGCRSDLRDNPQWSEMLVKRPDAEHLAKKIKAVYCETSALTGAGINECMEAAVLAVLERRTKTELAKTKGILRFFRHIAPKMVPVIQHPFNFMDGALSTESDGAAACDSTRGNLPDNMPSELLKLGPEFWRIYDQACKEGFQRISRVRVMLVGHGGAGKTSVKRYLLDEEFLPDYAITNGIESCKVSIENTSSNWKIKQAEQINEHSREVAKLINEALKHQNEQEHLHHQHSQQDDGDKRGVGDEDVVDQGQQKQQDMEDNQETPELCQPATSDTTHKKDDWTKPTTERSASTPMDVPADVLSELKDLMLQPYDDATQATYEENQVNFSFWDFAGQAELLPMHQAFLTHRALFLLVLDLTRPLETSIETYRHGRYGPVLDQTCPQSVQEYLDYWMDLIHTHMMESVDGKTAAPCVILVGTHRDQVDQDKIEEYETTVFKFLEKKAYFRNVHTEFIQVANNYADDPALEKLRQAIMDIAQQQPYWGEQIPLQWIALSERLRQLSLQDIYIINQSRVQEIAKDVGLSNIDDLHKILTFYHEMGDIIFFDEDGLKDFIVLNPQWLIDALSKIITISHFHQQENFPDSRNLWRILEDHGILHDSVLDHVWDPKYKRHLTSLMQKFRLMFPLKFCHMTDVYQEMLDGGNIMELAYLVPCLLPPVDEQSSIKRTPLSPPSVFIVFRDEFLPLGVTSQLITTLVVDKGWFLFGKLHHNYSSFLPGGPDTDISITIHEKKSILEVQGNLLDSQDFGTGVFKPYLDILLERLKTITQNACPKAVFQVAVQGECKKQCLVKIGVTGEHLERKSSLICHEHRTAFRTEIFSPWFYSKAVNDEKKQGNMAAASDVLDSAAVAYPSVPLTRNLKKKLKSHHVKLVAEIMPSMLYDYLLQCGTLSYDEIEEIKINATRAEQVRRLLKYIHHKSTHDYKSFKDALLMNGHEHVAKLL